MKTIRMAVCVIALIVAVTGCSSIPKVQQIANNEVVPWEGPVEPPVEAERIVENGFANSMDIPWDAESLYRVRMSRDAISSMHEYLESRLSFDSSIPYYTYKSSFEFIQSQYNKLQRELDDRVKVPGAVPEEVQVIYHYVKRDVNRILDNMRLRIASTEKNINDKASKNALDEMKAVYSAIKPLVDMAL